MDLVEALKTKLFKQKIPDSYTDTDIDFRSVDKAIKSEYDGVSPNFGFFDNEDDQTNSLFRKSKRAGVLFQQADLINMYRRISNSSEGRQAIDEIINEAIFSPGATDVLKIEVDDSKLTEKTCQTIIENFNEIQDIFEVDLNIAYLFERWYVDGQLVTNIVYDNKDLSKGIIGFNILDPRFFMYDRKDQIWMYAEEVTNTLTGRKELAFNKISRKFVPEEIVYISSDIIEDAQVDFNNEGLKLVKSHVHQAIKPHNQLTTLEDMLIPMRFSRSVSRRVFNVDVGDLPPTKAEAALTKIKDKFKYKKFYDVEQGTISNQMHIASLVEDYWFQNRAGSKGTTVETLDESGNLGEIGDILYFRKKLYTSLKVPLSRMTDSDGAGSNDFDYSATQISREEIKFYAFIQRLRKQFLRLFKETLKRHMLYKGVIASESEWNNIRKYIDIKFYKENVFLETMEAELLDKRLAIYSNIEGLIGKEFSKGWVRSNVLKLSDEEIETMQKEIDEERKTGVSDGSEDDATDGSTFVQTW